MKRYEETPQPLDPSLLDSARLLFEQAAVGIAQLDTTTGRFLRTNRKYSEILGYSAEELRHLDFMRLTHPDDLGSDLANMELLKSGALREFSMEKRLFRNDGSLIWINLTVSPVWPVGAAPSTHIAVIEDISTRKISDIALQALSTGLARLTGDDFFREACRCMARLLEVEMAFVGRLIRDEKPYVCSARLWSGEKMLSPMEYSVAKTPCEHVVGRDAAIFSNHIQKLFPEDRALEELGAESYAAVPIFDSRGHPLGHVGIMSRRPLTNDGRILSLLKLFAVRIAAELERQQSETQLHDLFEFAPDGLLIIDPQGVISLVNLRALQLFGYQRGEVVGVSVERLIPEVDWFGGVESQTPVDRGPRLLGSRQKPLYARRRDGSTFAVEVSLIPLRLTQGVSVVASVRDVTERVQSEESRQRLEAQLRQSQKMEAIGTLAGGIAHDFNNLLGIISANTALAREEAERLPLVLEPLDEIEVATTRATELVGQILSFSRKQLPNQKIVSLRSLLEETLMLLRSVLPAGIALHIELNDSPSVLANAAQIQQVVMNLSTNAWHALDGRAGRITLTLDEVNETTDGFPSTLEPGRYARITVSDNGKGIAPSDLDRIFEPFFTTKDNRGSGLGLSVVHGIVQAHKGNVTVQSQPNQGASFSVYLPASQELVPSAASMSPSGQPGVKGKRILFLDDEPGLVSVALRILDKRGYQAEGFVHPQQALDAISKDPTRFDLVISDFNMPSLSGLEVALEISKRWPSLPVMVVSGHLEEPQRARLLAAGVKVILEKPYSTTKLTELIEQLIAHAASPAAR